MAKSEHTGADSLRLALSQSEDISAFVAGAIRIGLRHGCLSWTRVHTGPKGQSYPSKRSITLTPAMAEAVRDRSSEPHQ